MKRILLHVSPKSPNDSNELRVNPEMIESYIKEAGKPGSIVYFQGVSKTEVLETAEEIDQLIDALTVTV